MKRRYANFAVGMTLCLTMALAPAALYRTVTAGIEDIDGKVFTAETPVQYEEEFSGDQAEPIPASDNIFIPDAQLEIFKQAGLRELSNQGLNLPDYMKFNGYFDGTFFAPDNDTGGMSLGLLWYDPDDIAKYISIGFNNVNIDEGSGELYFIQAYDCYDLNLLGGFINIGAARFSELVSPIPENFEAESFLVWQYNDKDASPETRVSIIWNDPLKAQIMTSLALTGQKPELLEYSITFDMADVGKQRGNIIGMFRSGVFYGQQDRFRPLDDFTVDETELMEKTARKFAEDMGIYAGDTTSSIGFNFGAGTSGIRFEFDSEGRNGYDHAVIITVTRTGMIVGYAVSL